MDAESLNILRISFDRWPCVCYYVLLSLSPTKNLIGLVLTVRQKRLYFPRQNFGLYSIVHV